MADKNIAKATVKSTGEVLEFPMGTPEEMIESYAMASDYKKGYERVLEQIKSRVPDIVDARGMYEYNGKAFRVSSIQRMNYDKSVLDRVIEDEDLKQQMLEPNKKFIDEWLKENIDKTGDLGSELRNTMIPIGNPYQVIKQEKI